MSLIILGKIKKYHKRVYLNIQPISLITICPEIVVLERRAEFQEKKQKFKQRVHIPN
jgi:hypothetical protein